MTYVMSDIHGEYGLFLKMLEEIRFSDNDVLYIAGDFVDYGEESMTLLCDVSMRANVIPVAGEHDLLALRMLTEFDRLSGSGDVSGASEEMKDWLTKGGKPTLMGFHALDEDMKEGVLDYLSEMVLFEEVEVKNNSYLIVHAGLRGYEDTPLEELTPEAFLSESLDPEREYFEDKTVVVGHIHTSGLPDADKDMIYYGEGSIFLDCGAGKGGCLGCLCLDNGKEYYVS